MLAILASMVAGFLLSIMIKLNASLGQHIGVLESSFIVHLVGALFALVLVRRIFKKEFITQLISAPKYSFLGGVIGVLVVLVANIVVPKLGMGLTTGVFITTNLMFCTIADHFGFFGLPKFKLTTRRVLGLLSAVMGLILLIWR